MASRIRVISKYDKPDVGSMNWVNEFARMGITLKPENAVESMTINEVTGKIIAENKPLTMKRAIELGMSLGVKNLQELHANVPGSYTSHISAIQKALDANLPKGIDAGMSADVRISACLGDMPKEVLIKVWKPTNDGHKTTYYLCPVGLDKDGNVAFGDAEEVDVSAQFSPVDISKPYAKSKKEQIAAKEAEHERWMQKDASFFESVKHKQDRAEKRGRLPGGRVFPTEDVSAIGLSDAEIQRGVQQAIDSGEFYECVQAVGRKVLDGKIPAVQMESIVTKGLLNLAASYAQGASVGTAGSIEQCAACDFALVADQIIETASSRFWIPSNVMKTAVENAQVEMENMGGLWCYSEHQIDLNGC